MKKLNTVLVSALSVAAAGLFSSASAFDGSFRSDWVGKEMSLINTQPISVVVFVKPDCASCSHQISSIASLQRKNPNLKVNIVTEQDSAEFRDYMGNYALEYNTYTDPSGEIIKALDIKTLPTTIFMDKSGKIGGFYEGVLDQKESGQVFTALSTGNQLPNLIPQGRIGGSAPNIEGVDWKKSDKNLVVFVSSICSFCIKQIPNLIDYASTRKDIEIYLIAMDDLNKVKAQYSKAPENIRFVDVEQPNNNPENLAKNYKAGGTPSYFFVNGNGLISYRHDGFDAEKHNPFIVNHP